MIERCIMSRDFRLYKNGTESLDANELSFNANQSLIPVHLNSGHMFNDCQSNVNYRNDNTSRKHSSGFILLSVKHLSNTRSERSRKRLFTSTNNGIKSGVNDSYGEHYPSGSTEADDFEDSEDHDDYENNMEDGHPYDLRGSFNLSKNSFCSSDHLDNYTRDDKVGFGTPRQCSVSHHFLTDEWTNGSYPHLIVRDQCNHDSLQQSQLVSLDTPNCEHSHFSFYDGDMCVDVSNNVQNLNLKTNVDVSKNQSSSLDFKLRKKQFYALPLVRSANVGNFEFSNAPHNSSNWGNLNEVLHQSYRRNISARLKHGNYNQSSMTCHHHLHSNSSGNFTEMNSASGTNHISAEVVASLPPLQPASRFRKARIHETVEQWSLDRFSVHDCHLKTIPEWVKELQKKSAAYEETLTNAINSKVRCISCFTINANDKKENSVTKTVEQDVRPSRSCQTIGSEPSVHKKLTILEDALEASAMLFGCNSKTNDLFSFWQDGSRVQSHLPQQLTCFDIKQFNGGSDFGDICNMCGNTVNKFLGFESIYPNNNNDCTMYLDKDSSDHKYDLISNDTKENHDFPNSLDPSTAYLRHRNTIIDIQIDDRGQIIPGDADDNLKVSKQSGHKSQLYCDLKFSENKSSKCLTDLLNITPPTSPNVDSLMKKPCRKHSQMNSSPVLNNSDLISTKNDNFLFGGGYHYQRTHPYCNFTNGLGYDYKRPNNKDGQTGFVPAPFIHKRLGTRNRFNEFSPTSKLCKNLCNSHAWCAQYKCRNHDYTDYHSDGCYSLDDYSMSKKMSVFNVKRACTTGSIVDFAGVELSKDLAEFTKENDCNVSKESSVLSDRLEARIRASMEAIRSTLVSSFRDELTTILAENVSLRSELNRVKSERKLLFNYQEAMIACRPFVPSEVFKQICLDNHLPSELYGKTLTKSNQISDNT